jgi:hypothetical protein
MLSFTTLGQLLRKSAHLLEMRSPGPRPGPENTTRASARSSTSARSAASAPSVTDRRLAR